jgi:TonB family protein
MRYYMICIFACFIIFSNIAITEPGLSPLSLSGQTQPSSEWVRYTTHNEEFTILFPELPSAYFLGTAKPGYRYAAYSKGVVFNVTSLIITNPNFPLQVYINDEKFRFPNIEFTFKGDIILNKFPGKQYSLKIGDIDGVVNFYQTKKHIYFVQAVGADTTEPAVQKFLDSFTLGDKLPTQDISKGSRTEEQKVGPDISNEPVFKAPEVTRKAIILIRPEALLTPQAIKHKTAGTVVVKAVLRASGIVTDINVVSGLPDGLTENAVESTRKIYFIPAMKDGKQVSQSIQIEYNFSQSK